VRNRSEPGKQAFGARRVRHDRAGASGDVDFGSFAIDAPSGQVPVHARRERPLIRILDAHGKRGVDSNAEATFDLQRGVCRGQLLDDGPVVSK
jgi:hypothetical protein